MRAGYVRRGASRSHEPRERDRMRQEGEALHRIGKKARKSGEGKKFSGTSAVIPRVEEWMITEEAMGEENKSAEVCVLSPNNVVEAQKIKNNRSFASIVKTGANPTESEDVMMAQRKKDVEENEENTQEVWFGKTF
ncbi:uncharacterized protein DS421_15g518230 [Arachis hypogaea]|nr:uncharacterized protein DS421_15g518230 [Arachis hypogaea]